jgi:predicted HTH domain antitoxin
MQITVELPDEIARRLSAWQPDLSRAVLEATAIEAVRDGVISAGKAAEMLGVSRDAMDGILKRAEVYLDYTVEEVERDRETHRRLGI